MPNVVRGSRMHGLLTYLVGPGRANEHTEPHLVAGDAVLMAWHDDNELGAEAAHNIARHLERPSAAFGVQVKDGHVWHCSLSLRAEEGQLTDEQWGDIARDFVAAMEFDDNEGAKAPCRWVAVRHGLSKNGNDHIHIAVNLVREDGTKASTHFDFRRAQQAARLLEKKYSLEQLESVQVDRATRGFHPAEREAQGRARARAKYERAMVAGAAPWSALDRATRDALVAAEVQRDQPRERLALRVRGCATAAQDEAEFVRRMRRSGLLVRPRFADGQTDVVTGYSVAARPVAGERPIWYGGGHLGRDLTLPRLRADWPDEPASAAHAAAEWLAAKRGRRPVAPGAELRDATPEMWDEQNTALHALVSRIKDIDVTDHAAWATVARQGAGVLAAWSTATESVPGDLGIAATLLSRSAQSFRATPPPRDLGTSSLAGAAILAATLTRGGRGTAAQALMLRQLLRLIQAVHDVSVAHEQARQAASLANEVRRRLVAVRDRLPAPSAGLPQHGPATPEVEPKQSIPDDLQRMLERVEAARTSQSMGTAAPVSDPLIQADAAGAQRHPEQPTIER